MNTQSKYREVAVLIVRGLQLCAALLLLGMALLIMVTDFLPSPRLVASGVNLALGWLMLNASENKP